MLICINLFYKDGKEIEYVIFYIIDFLYNRFLMKLEVFEVFRNNIWYCLLNEVIFAF